MNTWNKGALILLLILAVFVLSWELIGIRHAHDAWPSITEVITLLSKPLYVKLLVLAFLVWLVVHFYLRFAR